MKKIGIIGGSGPMITAHLYLKIVRLFQDQGAILDTDFPDITVRSVPFPDVMEENVNEYKIFDMMQEAVNDLQNTDFIALTCNSIHNLFPSLRTNVPIIDMVEETVKAVNAKKILLLATSYSVNEGLYKKLLEEKGVEVITPEDQDKVDEAISLTCGGKDGSKPLLEAIEKHDEDIILGCTELCLYKDRIKRKLFSSLDILAEKCYLLANSSD